jgi:FolB domain-containing protein
MHSSHRFAKDKIFIDQVSLKCICGRDAFGRRKAQHVLLSMELGSCIARAATDDRVDLSVDYSVLVKQLTDFEDGAYDEVNQLLEQVAGLALKHELVGNVMIKAELEKGSLNAERVVWETNTHSGENVASQLRCRVEGIQLPIIIGIEENEHERTQKQPVIIDLDWQGYDNNSQTISPFDLKNMVNEVITVYFSAAFLTLESFRHIFSVNRGIGHSYS